jgi:plasmid stability protein
MWYTRTHATHMGVMIQIRNVPEKLHRQLKSRAALAGMSLSDYLLQEIRQSAERPTIEEFRVRLKERPPVTLSISPAEVIRAERDREC